MTLKKVKLLHALMIRISGDSGEQIGAHVEYVERIVDTKTGAVEAAKLLPPEPLEPGADALTPLIGEVIRAQQVKLDQLERDYAALMEALAQEQEAHRQTQQGAVQTDQRLAEVQAELLALQTPPAPAN